MKSSELRKKFLRFFEKRGHEIVPSSSLIPSDPTVLFTTAGMQQFKEYFLGKPSPWGNRVCSCQKCFRTSDIDEVGDTKHLTFLEMLGNFSFGSYFKKEAIDFAIDFLFKELGIPFRDAVFTVFEGDGKIPFDKESYEILKKFGIPEEKIKFGKREDNFWGPTGNEGPCGPTAEILIKDVELWNLVFNEYYQDENGNLRPLKQKGVDTGMGLERLAMICQGKPSVYETDLFLPIIEEIARLSSTNYKLQTTNYRIITDHIKGSVFLSAEGILPSNVERGYILRRIVRRAIRYGKVLNLPEGFLIPLSKKVIEIYKDEYLELELKKTDILTVLQNEEEKFTKALGRGLKQFKKISAKGKISGIDAFHLFDTFGFPLELTQELAKEKGLEIDIEGFNEAFEKHREISRAGAEKKFGGVGLSKLKVKSEKLKVTKLHTATHLLQAALKKVLGEHVRQMGSDVTPDRLRFDFSHSKKMTPEEIKKVEDLVNQKIKEDLEVKKEEMRYQEALKSGALAFFKEKYPEIVTVFSIGNFSKEICAGPHVNRTSELGHFKIVREESSGAGIRRIRAILE